MTSRRLQRQLGFVRKADALKQVLRQGLVFGGQRRENSAEHSWHLALMVIVLHEHSKVRINLAKALHIAILHDLAEILVGDAIIYDQQARARKAKQEPRAAARLFGMLPGAQGRALLKLWNEYEENKSPEARFVRTVDRLEPLMANYLNKGYSWKKFKITAARIQALNDTWRADAPALGDYADWMIKTSVRRKHLQPR